MRDLTFYHERREALKQAYLRNREVAPKQVKSAGVDHLVLICSKLDRTIEFCARCA
jgi:hypothetical protein